MHQNANLFNLIELDDQNVYDYLPDLRTDINDLPIALKTDYIRVALLYYYGGLWLDADTIMMTDMHQVVRLLNRGEDFIGFGCTGNPCTNGYGVPSNGAMAAKKQSVLMEYCLDQLDDKLDELFEEEEEKEEEEREDKVYKNLGYYDLGKFIIWNGIKHLEDTQGYKYHHFPSYVDGTRNKEGYWIAKELIKPIDIQLQNEDKLMMVFLVNSTICGKDPEYNWFCGLSEDEILDGDYFVTHLFRRALKL
jgi:hypothetical protein